MLQEGLCHSVSTLVTTENTAIAMGSGDMPVFATPALVALMENAAMMCVQDLLPDGSTTVGGWIEVKHLKASAVNAEVKATATLTMIDGIKLSFDLVAYQGDIKIGEGKHLRFIVEREKFLSKL